MKKLVTFLCAFLLLIGTVSIADAYGLSLPTFGGPLGHYYSVGFYNTPGEDKTWDRINTDFPYTTGYTWYLATITSSEEQAFIESLFRQFSGEYWIGAYQTPNPIEPAGNWAWVSGEIWSYTNWAGGEPNDLNGEDYAAVWSNYAWDWNDEGNLANISGFVLESAPIPEPATMLLLGCGLIGLAGYGRKKFFKKG